MQCSLIIIQDLPLPHLVILSINHSVNGITPRVSLPVDLEVVVLHVDDGLGVAQLQLPGEPPQLSPTVLGSPGDVL